MDLVTLIGFLAGGLVLTSAIPQIIKTRRLVKAGTADEQSILRNVLVMLGNGLWVIYGTAETAYAVAVTCGINTVLHGYLIYLLVTQKTPSAALR